MNRTGGQENNSKCRSIKDIKFATRFRFSKNRTSNIKFLPWKENYWNLDDLYWLCLLYMSFKIHNRFEEYIMIQFSQVPFDLLPPISFFFKHKIISFLNFSFSVDSILPVWVLLWHSYVWCKQKPEDGIWYLELELEPPLYMLETRP